MNDDLAWIKNLEPLLTSHGCFRCRPQREGDGIAVITQPSEELG